MAPERLGELIDRHAAVLVLYARQWCATPEDVVQEAFVKLSAQDEEPHTPLAWLYRTVRNGAISAARSAMRRRRHEGHAAELTRGWFREDTPAGLDADVVIEALADLPVQQREVIVAHIWGELTFAQIGEISNSSAATAHRRYSAGLELLRERLGEPCQTRPKH